MGRVIGHEEVNSAPGLDPNWVCAQVPEKAHESFLFNTLHFEC